MTFTYSPLPVVVDASVAIELIDGDVHWRQAFGEWGAGERLLLAPPLFLTEVANGLMRGVSPLAAGDALVRLERLLDTGIETVERGVAGLEEAMFLAERHRLTVYDALYLQLALDVDGELATLDADLRKAAIAEHLTITDPEV